MDGNAIDSSDVVAEEIVDIKFLCLMGTVFDQETRVCERVDEVDCSQSEKFYDLNLNLYQRCASSFGPTTIFIWYLA